MPPMTSLAYVLPPLPALVSKLSDIDHLSCEWESFDGVGVVTELDEHEQIIPDHGDVGDAIFLIEHPFRPCGLLLLVAGPVELIRVDGVSPLGQGEHELVVVAGDNGAQRTRQ